MPIRIALAAIALFSAHLAWAARIGFGETPLTSSGRLLVAADLILVGAVATVGLLLDRTPWTRRLALAAVGILALLALTHSIDPGWMIAAGLSAIAGIGLSPAPGGRWFTTAPRQPVPAKATALALSLLVFPGLIGAAGRPQPTQVGLIVAGLAVIGAWAYARAIISVLWIARIGWPIATLAAIVGLTWQAAGVVIAAGAAVTWLAWSPDARAAAGPLTHTYRAVPVLPEMVPEQILDSAGFDSKGRPKGRP